MPKPRGLGKGLEALFLENNANGAEGGQPVTLRLSEVVPNRAQPRKSFDEAALAELSESIRRHGVLQPLLVRPLTDGSYQLVAGERRWRAARMAALAEVPVIIREMSDRETAEIALIENLQREDLSPLEEARGYQALIEGFQLTQEQVAQAVGKSRSAVANALRLLRLPEGVSALLEAGRLSAGGARALLAVEDPAAQTAAAARAVEQGLSVREVERLVKSLASTSGDGGRKPPPPVTPFARPSFYAEVELTLAEHLHRKVKVTVSRDTAGDTGDGAAEESGQLTLAFYGREDLQRLAQLLGGGSEEA